MKKIVISLLVAGAAVAANAQDKALLETLVKKGMLTQQEAAQIAKESVAVTPATKSTKSIKIFGGAQGWYTWGKDSVKSGGESQPQQSGFTLRYVKLGVEADVGAGWSATVVTDFGTEGSDRNYLDKVVASKKIDLDYLNGTLQLGLRKVNMGYEQNMCDFGQLAIERSVATFFFTRAGSNGTGAKNFGSRTVGVFWDGNITQVDGLYYSAAVTSGVSEGVVGYDPVNNIDASSSLSFWAAIGYKNVADIKGESLAYDLGINFGYAPQGMTNYDGNPDAKGSVWGINPYATVSWRGLTLIGEFFLQQAEDYTPGRDGVGRTPMGANVTAAYKMDIGEWGAIEPVFRFSCITTNGMGAETESGMYFDEAMTFFGGVNWYATPAVKTSLGYEFGYFQGASNHGINSDTANRLYGNTVRAQVQVLF